jgi:hypothetical protein
LTVIKINKSVVAMQDQIVRIVVALSTLLAGVIIIVSYLTEVSASEYLSSIFAPSYAKHSLSYEIQQPATLSVSNLRSTNNNTISANTTMALVPNPSTIVYETEEFRVPSSAKTFVIYMANEFHENWPEDSHKLITNKNAYIIPTKLVVSNGTSIAFHLADAPWDTPHDYIVSVIDIQTNDTAWQTPLLSYPKYNGGPSNSGTTVLPVGEYRVEAYLHGTDKVETKPITINITDTPRSQSSNNNNNNNNITLGFFYSPQKPVANPYDNDGELHYGHLEYYRQQFPVHGLKIESIHSFHFASCSFYGEEKSSACTDEGGSPGELYWHDNKTADHVLIFWSSTRPYNEIAAALDELTWENVYT